MKKSLNILKEYGIITIGTIITAAAVYFFMLPSNLSVGSISGLANILASFIPLSFSAITMILNAGLLVVGFLLIGKDFGIKTVYTSLLLPLVYKVFEQVWPNNTSIMEDPFLDLICYVFVVSVGLAILFNLNASSGGLDIVAKLLNKYLHMNLGVAMTMSGMVVAICSIFIADRKLMVLSILGTYFGGVVLDKLIFGFNIKRKVCILSKERDKIKDFILHDLHSGATTYEARGAYNNEVQTELVAIVDKHEYQKLLDFVVKTDSAAFITVYEVNNVIYRPKFR